MFPPEAAASFGDELAKVINPKKIVADSTVLEGYSKDCSFVAKGSLSLVVHPENKEEVQRIVRLSNDHKIPLVPVSSGSPRFHGDTVPSQGGVIVDFSKMKRILKIDPLNRYAMVEPGVTYGEFRRQLTRKQQPIRVDNAPFKTNCRVPRWPHQRHSIVAVGTTVADRPPHRSVRARLRTRLLPRMSGVEALIWVRVQNAGFRNSPVQQWGETIPSYLPALTATN